MDETIMYYNQNADAYISSTINADMSKYRDLFLRYVAPNGKILDAGCGSGRDSRAFLQAGYEVVSFDGSEEICRIVSDQLGIKVECRLFEDMTEIDEYDGIWACASLLHVHKRDLLDIVKRMHAALKPNGVLYASFKQGTTERIENGRFFCDMTEDNCRRLFEDAGFFIQEILNNKDVRDNHTEISWINIIGTKTFSK